MSRGRWWARGGRGVAAVSVVLVVACGGGSGDVDAARRAAAEGDVAALRRFHEEGVDLGGRGHEDGKTPLIAAAVEDDSGAAVAYLIEAGVDLDARDDLDVGALEWALIEGNVAAVRLLLAAGAEEPDDACRTIESSEVTGEPTKAELGGALGCP